MSIIFNAIAENVDWAAIFYVVVVLLVLTYLDKILKVTFLQLTTHLFSELGNIARNIKSRESLNGLIVVTMTALICLFFGSHVVRELSEVVRIFEAGTSDRQSTFVGIFAILVLAVTGLLSMLATRR